MYSNFEDARKIEESNKILLAKLKTNVSSFKQIFVNKLKEIENEINILKRNKAESNGNKLQKLFSARKIIEDILNEEIHQMGRQIEFAHSVDPSVKTPLGKAKAVQSRLKSVEEELIKFKRKLAIAVPEYSKEMVIKEMLDVKEKSASEKYKTMADEKKQLQGKIHELIGILSQDMEKEKMGKNSITDKGKLLTKLIHDLKHLRLKTDDPSQKIKILQEEFAIIKRNITFKEEVQKTIESVKKGIGSLKQELEGKKTQLKADQTKLETSKKNLGKNSFKAEEARISQGLKDIKTKLQHLQKHSEAIEKKKGQVAQIKPYKIEELDKKMDELNKVRIEMMKIKSPEKFQESSKARRK